MLFCILLLIYFIILSLLFKKHDDDFHPDVSPKKFLGFGFGHKIFWVLGLGFGFWVLGIGFGYKIFWVLVMGIGFGYKNF